MRPNHESFPMIGDRRAAFLRWRFRQGPGPRGRFALLARRGSTREIAGYAAVEREGDVAHLRDLFAQSREATARLLDLLLPALLLGGAVSVSFRLLGPSWLTDLLAARGFARRESARSVFIDRGASCPLEAAALGDSGRWYLTDADEDG